MANRLKYMLREVAHTLEAVTSKCGEFNEEWKARVWDQAPATRWEGEWRSERNQHHGRLRCILQCAEDGKFVAFFQAKYSRFLRACYKVTLNVSERNGFIELEGRTDLGPLAGGVYSYRGHIEGDEFLCRYECGYDEGIFELKPANQETVSARRRPSVKS